MNRIQIAKMIDHTLLKAGTTADQIEELCREALEYQFASVCVPPYYLPLVSTMLKGQGSVLSCTVISFPLGYDDTDTKVASVMQAVENGADELDVVTNIAAIKNGEWDYIEGELSVLRATCLDHGKILKIIFETCYLNDGEITKLAELCAKTGVDYVKTSTGFGTGGATLHHIALMRQAIDGKCKIKASGGIRSWSDAKQMIDAGAHRIGASAGVKILEEYKSGT